MKTRIEEALRRRHRKGDEGFTLIELLVVILIIAILAAVGIVALLSALNAGRKSSATTVVRNAITSVRSAQTGAGTTDYSFLGTDAANAMGDADPDINWQNAAANLETGNNIWIDAIDDRTVVLTSISDNDVCYYAHLNSNPSPGAASLEDQKATVYGSLGATAGACPASSGVSWAETTNDGWDS